MADMNLQIKISSQFEEAVQSVKKLRTSFLSLIAEITNSTAAIEAFKKAGVAISDFGSKLSSVGGAMKRFGKEFSKYISAPIALLAGLSLKKVFDEALSGRGSANADAMAASIQNLKRTFDQLLLTIGNTIAPIITKAVNLVNGLIIAFNKLSPAAQRNIIIFAGVAAAIGPIIVAFGTFLGIAGKLVFVFGQLISAGPAIIGFFASPLAGAIALIVSVGSLVNLFADLSKAGVGAGEAIYLSFKTASTFLSEKFYGAIGKTLDAINELHYAGAEGSPLGDMYDKDKSGLKKASEYFNSVSDAYSKEFDKIKADVDAKLKPIGTSMANSLTFGLLGAVDDAKKAFSGLLNPADQKEFTLKIGADVGKMRIDVRDAINKVKQDVLATNLELERLEYEHQNKMNNLKSTSGDIINQEIFDKQEEFLARKYELQIEEIEAEREKNLAIADLETDKTAKSIAISTAENSYKLSLSKATSDQQIAIATATAQAEEALLQRRQEIINRYAEPAASGLAEAFTSIADGTKTAGEALNDFARNFISQMTQMILKAALLQAITNAIGGFGAPKGAGNSFAGATPGFARGGFVSGPGTGTSDSIPAYLSNGEFVMKAAAVKNLGLGFLNGLNNIGRSGVRTKSKGGVRAFADGGMVTSAAQAPQVVIQNSGSPKQASSTEFDPVSATTTIILEDINRNGPIAKGFQSSFGMKRRTS